jgi:hypothetical protein
MACRRRRPATDGQGLPGKGGAGGRGEEDRAEEDGADFGTGSRAGEGDVFSSRPPLAPSAGRPESAAATSQRPSARREVSWPRAISLVIVLQPCSTSYWIWEMDEHRDL